MTALLEGRTAVVFGVANKRSIAWAIAQQLHEAGARLALTYQNERLALEAKDLVESLPGTQGFQCDVSNDAEVTRLFEQLKERYGKLDVLVHSIAFAPPAELSRPFVETLREGFRIAHDVSVYSLIALARGAAPLMTDGGSIITLTPIPRVMRLVGPSARLRECSPSSFDSVRIISSGLVARRFAIRLVSP